MDRSTQVALLATYLFSAAILGTALMFAIPGHWLVGDDHPSGSFQSLSEMLGEDRAYAESYRQSDPQRYQETLHRVRGIELRYWSGFAATALVVYAGFGLAARLARRPGLIVVPVAVPWLTIFVGYAWVTFNAIATTQW